MVGAKKTISHSPILLILLVLSLLCNAVLVFQNRQKPATGVLVVGVLDGDTLVLDGKTKVRLRESDAPEITNCGGEEAKRYLENMVVGKRVRIDEQVGDVYGRAIALVYAGDTLINEEMLKKGWSRYHHDVSSKAVVLKKSADEAKEKNIGIYGLCQSKVNQENPNCVIKGNIDKNSNARNYYVPGCAQYEFTIVEKDMGENWFCTEGDAREAGFTKAKTCLLRIIYLLL
ncbi:MAG: Micrococcal nuclease-like protein [Microgenomates group bacterium GW2011_GWC1_43_11]|nr:MAG: Micrococcal nuclease-like protein [Microgenomates group bacterium GW2011_GWC1_43_11]